LKATKKKNSEGCPSNQVSAAAMTSASDEKWRHALQRGETVSQLPSPKCGLRCNAAPFHSYV